MTGIECLLNEQFPETEGKRIEVMSHEILVYDDSNYDEILEEFGEEYGCLDAELVTIAMEKCAKTFKAPKGFLFVTLTDEDTIYPVKLD